MFYLLRPSRRNHLTAPFLSRGDVQTTGSSSLFLLWPLLAARGPSEEVAAQCERNGSLSVKDDKIVEKGCSFPGNGGCTDAPRTQRREHPCTLFYSVSVVLSWAF